MSDHTVLSAFCLTLIAGSATGIGSLMTFFSKRTDTRLLSTTLGFSAGVMIYVSFVEILHKARESLVTRLGESTGAWATVLAFFTGMLVIALIDKLVPSFENPHEIHRIEEVSPGTAQRSPEKLMRMGILSALAIAIHNFPEGLATFVAALEDPKLGVAITGAIALHNIPEGIAVSVPIFYATGSRRKALAYSSASGLAEPAGALVGYFLLRAFFGDVMFGVLFACVAGIMVFISLDELLPSAHEYGEHHLCIYGLVAGMGLMAVSLLLFA